MERVGEGNFRRRYDMETNETLFLFLGRIDPNKGVGLLIRAFARLRGRSRLAIVGPDEGSRRGFERLVARSGIGGSVFFTGPLYAEEKWSAFKDADVYVLPSVHENFGMTVLEAMICDTPVILTEGCGIAPQVKNRAGLVVPYDEEALSQAMRLLAEDAGLREDLAEGGRRLIEQEFSWEPVVEKLEDLYRWALTPQRRIGPES